MVGKGENRRFSSRKRTKTNIDKIVQKVFGRKGFGFATGLVVVVFSVDNIRSESTNGNCNAKRIQRRIRTPKNNRRTKTNNRRTTTIDSTITKSNNRRNNNRQRIMKYIYSFNSFNGKRLPTPFEKKMALLSVVSLHESTGEEITFYGDIDSVQFVLDNRIPFDNIYSHKFEHNNPVFWNTGKLEIYALQNEPFLHVDWDTVFFKGFSVPEADIVTEQIRDFEDSAAIRKFAIRELKNPKKLICSGLIGGTWNNAFYEIRENLYKNRGKLTAETAEFDELISLEEYTTSQIAEQYKLTVAELDKTFFAHWQGKNKESNFGKIIDDLCNMYGI